MSDDDRTSTTWNWLVVIEHTAQIDGRSYNGLQTTVEKMAATALDAAEQVVSNWLPPAGWNLSAARVYFLGHPDDAKPPHHFAIRPAPAHVVVVEQ